MPQVTWLVTSRRGPQCPSLHPQSLPGGVCLSLHPLAQPASTRTSHGLRAGQHASGSRGRKPRLARQNLMDQEDVWKRSDCVPWCGRCFSKRKYPTGGEQEGEKRAPAPLTDVMVALPRSSRTFQTTRTGRCSEQGGPPERRDGHCCWETVGYLGGAQSLHQDCTGWSVGGRPGTRGGLGRAFTSVSCLLIGVLSTVLCRAHLASFHSVSRRM